jgi:hypothetical protein
MISSGDWLTPTRTVGLGAYGLALTCSAIAWTRSHAAHRASGLAAWLTALECLLLIDMAVNGRWVLHDLLGGAAQRRHEYDLRSLPQSIFIAVLIAILLVGLLIALRLYRRRIGALLAISGSLTSVVSWCIEVVSLHAVDAILYHPIGRWKTVCIVWLLASLLTSIGILIDSRTQTPGK